MYPFLDTQLNTLLGLINTSNPGLKVPLTSAMLRSLVPTVITPGTGQIQDTSLVLLSLPGNVGKYIGKQTVTYRRINFTNLFRSMTLTLDNYIGSTTMTAAQFCQYFNAKFGTELVPTDFSQTTFTSGTQYTVTMVSASLCYEGSFSVKWTQAVPYMSQVISNQVLNGKLYPGGNTFGGGRKPQGEILTYGLDASGIRTVLLGLASSVTPSSSNWTAANWKSILSFLQNSRPDLNLTSADSATQGGIGNLAFTRYTLPSASVPGANSNKFTYVTTITAVAGSWFQGAFYLHFN